MLDPPSHVFFAVLGADLVVLDTRTDRYVAIANAVLPPTSDTKPGQQLLLRPEAEKALVEANLLDPETARLPASAARLQPSSSSDRPVPGPIGPFDLWHLLAAATGCFLRLRRQRPCSEYAGCEPSVGAPRCDPEVRRALGALATLRLIVPLPSRCLPAALITSLFLRRKGIDTQVVFGVRSHPFEAHCWVERDGILLEDDADRVRAFTPIAVGRP